MNVVKIQHSQMLCGSITGVKGGDTSIGYGGNGSGRARSNGGIDWDDWDE
jgi:hypothetical protein